VRRCKTKEGDRDDNGGCEMSQGDGGGNGDGDGNRCLLGKDGEGGNDARLLKSLHA